MQIPRRAPRPFTFLILFFFIVTALITGVPHRLLFRYITDSVLCIAAGFYSFRTFLIHTFRYYSIAKLTFLWCSSQWFTHILLTTDVYFSECAHEFFPPLPKNCTKYKIMSSTIRSSRWLNKQSRYVYLESYKTLSQEILAFYIPIDYSSRL